MFIAKLPHNYSPKHLSNATRKKEPFYRVHNLRDKQLFTHKIPLFSLITKQLSYNTTKFQRKKICQFKHQVAHFTNKCHEILQLKKGITV